MLHTELCLSSIICMCYWSHSHSICITGLIPTLHALLILFPFHMHYWSYSHSICITGLIPTPHVTYITGLIPTPRHLHYWSYSHSTCHLHYWSYSHSIVTCITGPWVTCITLLALLAHGSHALLVLFPLHCHLHYFACITGPWVTCIVIEEWFLFVPGSHLFTISCCKLPCRHICSKC